MMPAEHATAFHMRREIFDAYAGLDRDIGRTLRYCNECVLQICAVDRPEWRSVNFLGAAERNAHNLAPAATGHHANGVRRDDAWQEPLAQSPGGHHARRLGQRPE